MLELSGTDTPDQMRRSFAGDTLNTAWYAQALLPRGWQVAYLTTLGQDALSDQIVQFLKGAGISSDLIARHPTRVPGTCMIELHEGERSSICWCDLSAARCLADDPAHLARAFKAAEMVYFSGITLAILAPEARAALLWALRGARAAGARIAFDPNLRPRLWTSAGEMCAAVTEAAAQSDIVLPSHEDEAAHFADADPGATALRYLSAGAREVLVKNGGGEMVAGLRGAKDAPVIIRLPAFAPVVPVDTTGAGDSFNAGYLAARLQGAGPARAAAYGHEVACRVIGHRGALLPRAVMKRGAAG
jgi:2-dehydro-3-deoxygluconokinase